MKETIRTEINWKETDRLSATVEPIRELGAGRAATATLVRVNIEGREPLECVEKCFNPGLLTRVVYWAFMQSPFPYQHDRDAISAAYFRRAVAGKILAAMGDGRYPVAKPLYTRWDDGNKAFVLGAEFVKGRGIIPQRLDLHMMRRPLFNRLVRPLSRLFGKHLPPMKAPHEEVKELTTLMRRFEKLFRISGLIGTGWQASPATLVATANLLRTEEGYVMVDLESGIPSILVPYYLFRSIFTLKFPYFDDLEAGKLKMFVAGNRDRLIASFDEEGTKEFDFEVSRLLECSERWKRGEISLFRNLFTILFSPTKRAAVKRARIEQWAREGVIDEETYERVRRSGRLFTEPLFLMGALPGRFGESLRKLGGNASFRSKARLYLTNRTARRKRWQRYVDKHLEEWVNEERFPAIYGVGGEKHIRFGTRFLVHLMVSKVTSAGFHSFFVDHKYRKKTLIKAGLFFTSEKYQTEYSLYVIMKGLREWRDDGRMELREYEMLSERLKSGSIQEYVRLFGFQAALKLFEFVTSAIKVAGIGWFLATFAGNFPDMEVSEPFSGRLVATILKTAALNPISILMMINTSVWRTLITLSRMVSVKRRHITYKTALFFGMIPALGTLAYPVQMYASARNLSIYLMRHIFSRIGRNLPIYGGADSITELFMIKLINLLVEVLESVKWLWRHTAGALLGVFRKSTAEPRPVPVPVTENRVEKGKRSHFVDSYIEELWEDFAT